MTSTTEGPEESALTPFELWQAGEGREPVVIPKLPAQLAFMPPWRWCHLRHRERRPGTTWTPGQLAELLTVIRREEAEAAAEQRAALSRAVLHLPTLDTERRFCSLALGALRAEIACIDATLARYHQGSEGWLLASDRKETLEVAARRIADEMIGLGLFSAADTGTGATSPLATCR